MNNGDPGPGPGMRGGKCRRLEENVSRVRGKSVAGGWKKCCRSAFFRRPATVECTGGRKASRVERKMRTGDGTSLDLRRHGHETPAQGPRAPGSSPMREGIGPRKWRNHPQFGGNSKYFRYLCNHTRMTLWKSIRNS